MSEGSLADGCHAGKDFIAGASLASRIFYERRLVDVEQHAVLGAECGVAGSYGKSRNARAAAEGGTADSRHSGGNLKAGVSLAGRV